MPHLRSAGPPPPPPPPVLPPQSFLQNQYHFLADLVSGHWIINRVSGNSRGIAHVPPTNGPLRGDYVLASLQALLHLPRFMTWVNYHNYRDGAGVIINPCDPSIPIGHCTACQMKRLIAVYWGPHNTHLVTNAVLPLAGTHSVVQWMRNLASQCAAFPGSTDVVDFQDELLRRILRSTDNQHPQSDPQWSQIYQALFHLETWQDDWCLTCDQYITGRAVHPTIGFRNLDINSNLRQMITDRLQELVMTTNACQNCGNGVSMMESKLHINGAPEILRIQLYLGDHGEPKDKTPFSIPSQIDLKCFQLPANPVRPALNRRHLKYKLSSVISHFGEEVGTDDQNYYATCRAKRECFMIADHGVVQKTERELRENPQQWPGPNPPANEPCEAICLFYTRIR